MFRFLKGQEMAENVKYSKEGIASLVFAIIGFVITLIIGMGFGGVLGFFAIGAGILAIKHNDRIGIIGIILGILAFIFSIIMNYRWMLF